jgi:hypothetical protein
MFVRPASLDRAAARDRATDWRIPAFVLLCLAGTHPVSAKTADYRAAQSPSPGRQSSRGSRAGHDTNIPPLRCREWRAPPEDRRGPALLYVRGPTPTRLSLAANARFDGREWHADSACTSTARLVETPDDSSVLVIRPRACGPATEELRHEIRFGSFRSDRLPTPAGLTQFRRVVPWSARPGEVVWTTEDVLRLRDGESLPGQVIELTSRSPVNQALDDFPLPAGGEYAPLEYLRLPETLPDREALSALARSWCDHDARGWRQVRQVLVGLRRHCRLDAEAGPVTPRRTLGDFLLRERHGDSAQFASAAAVLLRLLGYPTRVARGFHVRAERFDPISHHTPVLAEDVHSWIELLLPGGIWIPLEPTPGHGEVVP